MRLSGSASRPINVRTRPRPWWIDHPQAIEQYSHNNN